MCARESSAALNRCYTRSVSGDLGEFVRCVCGLADGSLGEKRRYRCGASILRYIDVIMHLVVLIMVYISALENVEK